MIAYDAGDRLSLKQVLQHPWVVSKDVPQQQQVNDLMSELKSEFIGKTFEDQL
jgi:hypothetical protein